MTPLTNTDPSAVASAAVCFNRCVPGGDQLGLRSYLLDQLAQISGGGGSCVTPSAPSPFSFVSATNTSITLGWKIFHNTGSFITGFQIFYGTTSGGPYPNSTPVIPLSSRTYTVTGLTAGTTYYFVIQSIAGVGCTSANSVQASGTTTGSPPGNGLLNNLVHYYQMDSFAGQQVTDVINALTLTEVAQNDCSLNAGGIINSCIACSGGGGLCSLTVAVGATADVMAAAAGSQTFQMWIYLAAAQISATTGWIAANNGTNGIIYALQFSSATGKFTWNYQDTTNANVALAYSVAPTTQAWHHLVFGVDMVNSQLFMYLDGGGKQTVAFANGPKVATVGTNFNMFNTNPNQTGDPAGRIDETGVWHGRVLSASDVTTLYNGGAGLPESSFTT